MTGDRPTGVVLGRDAAAYRVALPGRQVRAVLRGKFKQEGTPHLVVGDIVRLDQEDTDPRGIVGVEPRRSLLERRSPGGRGNRPIAANIDEVLVVTAVRDPVPVLQLLDRFFVLAESNHLPAALAVNKTDLGDPGPLADRFRRVGYPVLPVCARSGQGMAELRRHLAGRTTVVTGPSGVGKSSLANALEPGLQLRVGEISARARRGRQTTVSAVMIPLEMGGFLVDTPGFSEVGLWGIESRDLAWCFPEMRPLQGECRFPDCHHRSEPGCAVLAAVETGTIARDRWESYLKLLEEIESAPKDWE
ncbi:MAG: ribosome small subunit-dependent GTPase A [Gemmatimonadales bacterium]